jgi:hypothetical protein
LASEFGTELTFEKRRGLERTGPWVDEIAIDNERIGCVL